MSSTETYVIVGASLAGAKAAETLREEGFDGRLVLIGAEPHPPYERPPLSKAVLRGEEPAEVTFVHPMGWYEDHGVELRLGTRVESIDPHLRLVEDAHGHITYFDKLLLTTGCRARRLDIRGATLAGIHHLRTIGDAMALGAAVAPGTRVAIVGAGWIGSEVAASLRQVGADVALIDPAPTPLHGVLGDQVGAMFRDLHAEHGVELHLGTGVERFAGEGRVTGVVTDDGATVPAEVVVVGVGAVPRAELAQRAGLAVSDGIVVDAHLQTSVPGIFAAGDVAAAWHPTIGRRLRVEHWANAVNQGVAAARSMLGTGEPYDRLPYFFSDQYDLGMEYSGHARSWDQVVLRGDLAAREVVAFWLDGGRVVAAMNANVWDVVEPLQALIRSGQHADPARLADPDVPLEALIDATAAA